MNPIETNKLLRCQLPTILLIQRFYAYLYTSITIKIPGGFRRVGFTTYLFGERLGGFFATKINPIFAVKFAWDAGTYAGCLVNCLE